MPKNDFWTRAGHTNGVPSFVSHLESFAFVKPSFNVQMTKKHQNDPYILVDMWICTHNVKYCSKIKIQI